METIVFFCGVQEVLVHVITLWLSTHSSGVKVSLRGRFTLWLFCSCLAHSNPHHTSMGIVWEVTETQSGILLPDAAQLLPVLWLFKECWLPSFNRSRDLQGMTITTQTKYDSKCHSVPLSCGNPQVTMSTLCHGTQSRVADRLCLFLESVSSKVRACLFVYYTLGGYF